MLLWLSGNLCSFQLTTWVSPQSVLSVALTWPLVLDRGLQKQDSIPAFTHICWKPLTAGNPTENVPQNLKNRGSYEGEDGFSRDNSSLSQWIFKKIILRRREGDNRGRDGWMASPTQWT